ncbi:Hypothetical protein Nlim_0697 [Candidatus Nitrosarchaeum limnium SFB1]|uniref:Uncharacterized protein n=1 Tax=Candidatus Nitrosarchaeum limnium SFB1 TaxID=886738 RepID=F3KJN9_9ARCH|nr:Hypothetical protein Nlim_0697 [Candidatus Nitrosarchaeum limnium SFB1]
MEAHESQNGIIPCFHHKRRLLLYVCRNSRNPNPYKPCLKLFLISVFFIKISYFCTYPPLIRVLFTKQGKLRANIDT